MLRRFSRKLSMEHKKFLTKSMKILRPLISTKGKWMRDLQNTKKSTETFRKTSKRSLNWSTWLSISGFYRIFKTSARSWHIAYIPKMNKKSSTCFYPFRDRRNQAIVWLEDYRMLTPHTWSCTQEEWLCTGMISLKISYRGETMIVLNF